MRKKKQIKMPELPELEMELSRVRYRSRFRKVLSSTAFTLVTVAALAVLVATLWLPVLRIVGVSMTPTLREGEIVVSVKGSRCKTGDVIAFYYNNKVLVKRVIAHSGQWVDVDENGIVSVDGHVIEEPYIVEPALGECNIELPFQVPDGKYFVMGDHRSTSIDSRNLAVGCVDQEQVVGRIVFCVWPLKNFRQISTP